VKREFWAQKPADDLAVDVNAKIRRYFEAMEQIGLIQRLRAQYRLYFMRSLETGADVSMLGTGDRRNPKVTLQLPEMRQGLRKQLAFIRQEKTGFMAVAAAGGQSSVVGSEFAEKALTYVYEQNIAPEIYGFAETAFVYAAAATHLRWNSRKGEDIETVATAPGPDGKPVPQMRFDEAQQTVVPVMTRVKSGAPFVDSLDPTMFAMDPQIGVKANWAVAFERSNIYALAAAFQDESIYDCTSHDPFEQYRLTDALITYGRNEGDVMVTHFYYADSPELPDGRHSIFVGSRPIYDQPRCPLRSGRLPVRVLSTGKYTDNAFSFGDSFGQAAIDQALTKIRSTEATNVARHSRVRLWRGQATRPDSEEAANDDVTVYVGGDSAPEYIVPPPAAEGLQLLKQDLIDSSSRVSGFSPVSAGSTGTTSGQHVREYEHITQRNLSLPSSQLLDHEVELANDVLELLRANASAGFVAEIAGPDGMTSAKMFTPDDLSTLRRIVGRGVPDAARSAIARVGLVELVSKIPDPIERGKAMSFILRNDDEYGKTDLDETSLVALENERLTTGEAPVFAVVTQDQQAHLMGHAAGLDRLLQAPQPDPEAIARYQEHIAKHGDCIRNQDPLTNMALGYPPPPLLPGTPAFQFEANRLQAQTMLGMVAPAPVPEQQQSKGGQ
jgi:hypothetical protein